MLYAFRYKLISFGVTNDTPDELFCNNKSSITNTSIPEYLPNKRGNGICYHMVIEAHAVGTTRLVWIPGEFNLEYLLTETTMSGSVRNVMLEKHFNHRATTLNE